MTDKDIIFSTELHSVADYINMNSKLDRAIKEGALKFGKSIRIAILASFTVSGIKEVLAVKCCRAGLMSIIYEGNYKQYTQEILDKNSNLYKFKPEFVIIIIDTMTFLGDHYLTPYKINGDERKKFIDSQLASIISLMDFLKENSSATILIHNFIKPAYLEAGYNPISVPPFSPSERVKFILEKINENRNKKRGA